jgi:pimeloyl-ACP methyl ester carboxylesterase
MRRLGAGAINDRASPAVKAFAAFMDLIQANFRPRMRALPRFGDEPLRRLKMPILAIFGAKDAMLDAGRARARLRAVAPHADIRWLPETGHFLFGHTPTIDAFLAKALLP